MNPFRKLSFHPPRPLVITFLAAAILMVMYIIVYQLAPFPEPWSDMFLVYSIVAAAFAAAIFSTFAWRSFGADDGPRAVWMRFSLAWWLWAVAELVWAIYYLFDPEVPAISLADPLWTIAYLLFGAAFLAQFRLVFSPSPRLTGRWTILVGILILAFSLAGTILLVNFSPGSEQTGAEAFVAVFYAVADLAMMVAAIYLARTFGRGLWGQAWLGLLAFVISDTLYSWSNFTGLYAYSLEAGNILTLVVDGFYLLAYLLIALACQMQYLLIRFGPSLRPLPQVDAQEPG